MASKHFSIRLQLGTPMAAHLRSRWDANSDALLAWLWGSRVGRSDLAVFSPRPLFRSADGGVA
jgi:hypothetical protein